MITSYFCVSPTNILVFLSRKDKNNQKKTNKNTSEKHKMIARKKGDGFVDPLPRSSSCVTIFTHDVFRNCDGICNRLVFCRVCRVQYNE